MKYCILLFLTTFFTNLASAQEKTAVYEKLANYEYVDVVKGGKKKKMPLLIAFHYSGGNPIETLADYDLLKTAVRIIIPKGNFPKRSGFSYYPTNYYQQDSLTQYNLAMKSVDSIAKFVAAIEKKYNTVAVVSGISQGGDISFLLAKHYPHLIQASFPFAAVIHSFINKELLHQAIIKKPIYIFQGESDQIIPHLLTKKKVGEIGNKMNIKLFTYPKVGHEISAEMKIDYSKLMDQYLKK
ncbi:alpha/beta hydrolase [Pedobacter insulae]|uniref:Dienelactone hydrolase family protein n=1 Tax=Pedobacter insulae TaxID=414048 RepID=A0A1I2Y8A0_9SPHI|nr:dienelactone hydrolase family protein [Pedobacter insulae]SFH21176.1 Dienelactone hydrolase family protein [Pedobacter insulae]